MIKKIIIGLFVLLPAIARANSNPIIGYVQLSTGPTQSGGFNTSTGTVGNFTASTATIGNLIVSTFSASSLTFTTTGTVLSIQNSPQNSSLARIDGANLGTFFGLNVSTQTTAYDACTAFGAYAEQAHLSIGGPSNGIDETAFGALALLNDTSGYENTCAGAACMHNNTLGNNNAVFGSEAFYGNTDGSSNQIFGVNAAAGSDHCKGNSVFGNQALNVNNPGVLSLTDNSAFGRQAGLLITTGTQNSLFGAAAGANIVGSSSNTLIGWDAGNALNGNQGGNVFVGFNAGPTAPADLVNAICLGYNCANNTSNTMNLGNSSISTTTIFGATSISTVTFTSATITNANLIGNVAFSSMVGTNFTTTNSTGTNATITGNLAVANLSGNNSNTTDVTILSTFTFSPTTLGVRGTTTANNANVGIVGEYVSSPQSTVTLTTAGYISVSTVTLTAGDWDISWAAFLHAATSASEVICGISTTANANNQGNFGDGTIAMNFSATVDGGGSVAGWRASSASTVPYYLTCKSFGGTPSINTRMSARRIR